jgi:hypothetical protein
MFRSTLRTLNRLAARSGLPALLLVATHGALQAQSNGISSIESSEPTTAGPRAPTDSGAVSVWEDANRTSGPKVVVSIDERRLWFMDGQIVLFTAPVAVGRSVVLEFEDKVWNFATPRGRRTVLQKERDPIWVPPDWHYVELALLQGWQLKPLVAHRPVRLSDGSSLVVRGRRVGRVLADGSFVPVPPGEEAVFDETLFMPPLDSHNRRIPGQLGRFKLDLGDAYYLHGTPDPGSIGSAATHGCIRLHDEDIEYLYRTVPVGTPVFLF